MKCRLPFEGEPADRRAPQQVLLEVEGVDDSGQMMNVAPLASACRVMSM